MKTNKRWALPAVLLVVIAGGITSCSTIDPQYATSTSDTHICVFDGSERGGQKLKFQVPPGAESKKIDDNDQVVKLPSSNRFYATTKNAARRDPLASEFYAAPARGSDDGGTVDVQIEGQIRFRFNLKLACEWYSKHGRRNADADGDLGFNCRAPGCDPNNAGWFKFLTENFGQTMDQAVVPVALNYQWKKLVRNYAVNANSEGILPEGEKAGEPTQTKFGDEAAIEFTKRLNKNLGGQYFCGVDTTTGEECPPLEFEVTKVTGPENLMKNEADVEQKRSDLNALQQIAELREQQQAATLANEAALQEELKAKLNTANLQAQLDTASCRAIIAISPNLDCKGNLAPVIVGGNN